jgi:hypothetical protein
MSIASCRTLCLCSPRARATFVYSVSLPQSLPTLVGVTPHAHSGLVIRGKTTTSFVTPDDYSSESEAKFAAEKIIRKL